LNFIGAGKRPYDFVLRGNYYMFIGSAMRQKVHSFHVTYFGVLKCVDITFFTALAGHGGGLHINP
jgi:hypothetical protein